MLFTTGGAGPLGADVYATGVERNNSVLMPSAGGVLLDGGTIAGVEEFASG